MIALAGVLFTVVTSSKVGFYSPEFGETVEFGGAIKTEPGKGWSIWKDPTHTPSNLESVKVSPYEVEVFYTYPLKVIHYASVTSHRRMLLQGIVCGASIGTQSLKITCVKDRKWVDMTKIKDMAYVWVLINGQ